MKYFLDTEFYEDGRTIELISIGIVREDGREFYACNLDADFTRIRMASPWLAANVLPQLPEDGAAAWLNRENIAEKIREFINSEKVEIWAYYADYDWVVFCQLFGTMIDLPKGFPMFCMDLKQLSVEVGSPEHPKQVEGEHNALADARRNKDLYTFLRSHAT